MLQAIFNKSWSLQSFFVTTRLVKIIPVAQTEIITTVVTTTTAVKNFTTISRKFVVRMLSKTVWIMLKIKMSREPLKTVED